MAKGKRATKQKISVQAAGAEEAPKRSPIEEARAAFKIKAESEGLDYALKEYGTVLAEVDSTFASFRDDYLAARQAIADLLEIDEA